MTFKDYALRDYDETSGILESDWYNAQVELLRLSSETWGNGLSQIEEGDFSLMRWYEYTLTLAPGQTLKNAVTAPLYPAIDAGYTPSLYSYTYLLSPAKTWAQFGELEVVVKTPYYMTESGIDGFTKTDGGYALTLPGLPESELTFTLSESEKPQPPKWSSLYLMPTEFSCGLMIATICNNFVSAFVWGVCFSKVQSFKGENGCKVLISVISIALQTLNILL